MSDLAALAERVEKAEGPSRELDAEIQVRVFEKPGYRFPDRVLNRRPADWHEAASRFRWDGGGGHCPWPAYTASLDAAMTLVPKGMVFSLSTEEPGPWAWVGPKRGEGSEKPAIMAATPALALVAAALRAKATGDEA